MLVYRRADGMRNFHRSMAEHINACFVRVFICQIYWEGGLPTGSGRTLFVGCFLLTHKLDYVKSRWLYYYQYQQYIHVNVSTIGAPRVLVQHL